MIKITRHSRDYQKLYGDIMSWEQHNRRAVKRNWLGNLKTCFLRWEPNMLSAKLLMVLVFVLYLIALYSEN